MTGVRSRSLERSIEDLVYRQAEPTDRIVQNRRVVHALIDIVDERRRQEEIGDRKREAGIEWRSCADPDMAGGDGIRFLVLGEEIGEAANAVLEEAYARSVPGWDPNRQDEHLREELVQIAAVAVAWVEAIDARKLPF